ncbi:MAG TPA: CsgG/HfaB family protein [Ignavibacteriaceae bacterium]|nr:CsgG/HfaB family protein [Ignavibacteriaceae bacterium]
MKILTKIIFSLLFITSALYFISCSSGSVIDDPELSKAQVNEWTDRINKDPHDFEALKNLAIYYMQAKQNEKAKYYIDKALEENPSHPALLLYKGLNLEYYKKSNEALNYYKNFDQVPVDSPYRELLEGRYLWLKRQMVYSEVDSLANENDLSLENVSENTLAVFPLMYHGFNEDYVPLSRGFSEMISIDLAKVNNLTILERIRIQAVIDEIKLSQSSGVDQSTAPRAGKLLRAGTIVSGDYDITEEKEFKINLGSWNVQTSEQKSLVNVSGNLQDLFELQKRVVFSFLERNQIELTQEEKEAIAYIPTQNLDAFLSYSKGLLQEDAGNFKEAETFYQNAIQIDPNFNAAGNKLESTQSIGKSSGSTDQLITNLKTSDPVVKEQSSFNIVSSRQQNLGSNISSNFVQGIDSRNPAQDQGLELVLPDPPPPPPPPSSR